ncbi:hypothetical protein Lpp124_06835, partial [Lacticaseibacillus paracasei subsp. paracasei CNCM I-4649]
TGKIALSLNGGYILFFLGGMLHSPELLMIPIFLLIYGNANFIKHIKGDEPYLFSNVGSLLIMTVCFATIFFDEITVRICSNTFVFIMLQ